MKNLVIFLMFSLFIAGCSFTTKPQPKATQNKTWDQMFDNNSWSAVNSSKLTENNKVVK
ncbi:hypothetical protein V6665_00360 (plasmid) [Campylobacter fetus]|uniref:hypothetical protein n=1 Tax=Campylobacter fetus TaxID=196 RepID=UPI00050913F2|nr:hypothetical protein [Campylobacter fetus]AIR81556.1 hypothetical protein CFV97608_a0006 [Campylobacter fetus subsp. venerealis 97/608]